MTFLRYMEVKIHERLYCLQARKPFREIPAGYNSDAPGDGELFLPRRHRTSGPQYQKAHTRLDVHSCQHCHRDRHIHCHSYAHLHPYCHSHDHSYTYIYHHANHNALTDAHRHADENLYSHSYSDCRGKPKLVDDKY
jgi:hypothetical protein